MEEFKPGDIVSGLVLKAQFYRTFVEVIDEQGHKVPGSISAEEYFWSDEENKDYLQVFKPESLVKLKVLSHRRTREGEVLLLSRRLAVARNDEPRDPWDYVYKTYQKGDLKSVRITELVGNYAFGSIEEGVKAFINVKELQKYLNNKFAQKHSLEDGQQYLRVEEVLLKGDHVRGLVANVDRERRLVKLDVIAHLEAIGEGALIGGVDEREAIIATHDSHPMRAATAWSSRIRRVFFADDDKRLCNEITEVLSREGILVTAFSELGEIESFIANDPLSEFDLFVIDLRFGNDIRAGINICRMIKCNYPRARVVLSTWQHEINHLQDDLDSLGITDVLAKPYDVLLATVILQDLGDEKERQSSPAKILKMQTRPDDTLKREIASEIKHLVAATKASAGGVFSYDPISEWVEIVAWEPLPFPRGHEGLKKFLHKSPIRDLLMKGEDFSHPKSISRAKYRYLLRLIDFQYAIGRRIEVPHHKGFCFFLFFDRETYITPLEIEQTATAAANFRSIYMNSIYRNWAEYRQTFYLQGRMLFEYGHELAGAVANMRKILDRLEICLENKSAVPNQSVAIEDSVNSLSQLWEQMNSLSLQLSEVSESRGKERLNLLEFTKGMISFVSGAIKGRKISISVRRSKAAPIEINVKKSELHKVFINVLANAIQQIEAFVRGQGLVEVQIECQVDSDSPLRVYFCDNGPGVHTQYYERIFEPLFTTREGGHGMGLAICRKAMSDMGGSIRVHESHMYEGTVFVVELPPSVVLQ